MINQDLHINQLSENNYYFAKNILINEGGFTNEKGVKLYELLENDDKIIGEITVADYLVIFVKGDVNKIVVCDGESSTVVLDSDGIIASLDFNISNPIQPVYKINNKNQCIIAFTDNFNPPYIINVGDLSAPELQNANDINDILLFPDITPLKYNISVETAGLLPAGAYYVAFSYKNIDTQTGYTNLSSPVYITSFANNKQGVEAESVTNKSIRINIDNIPSFYDSIVPAIVYKVGGDVRAMRFNEFSITGTSMVITISSLNGETISADEVLIPTANYKRIATITNYENTLFAGNVESGNVILDYQSEANNIVINYDFELLGINDIQNELKSDCGFIPGEVYAFYMRWHFNNGQTSQWFHIPGREEEAGDKTLVNLGGGSQQKKYQVETTYNVGTTSNMGFWENENELYSADFPDFAGQNVRHHKFPSLRDLRTITGVNFYQFSILPKLNITASNISSIPENASHWEIGYAKRTFDNSTFVGQGLLQYASNLASGVTTGYKNSNLIRSNTGNWRYDGSSDTIGLSRLPANLNHEYVRFHSPETDILTPSLSNTYIYPETLLQVDIFKTRHWDNNDETISDGNTYCIVDLTRPESNLVQISAIADSTPIKIESFEYLSYNSNGSIANVFNIYQEGSLICKSNPSNDFLFGFAGTFPLISRSTNYSNRTSYHIGSLKNLKSDVYNSYGLQSIVATGQLADSTDTFFTTNSGDCFINEYSHLNMASAEFDWGISAGNAGQYVLMGIHRFYCYSALNIQLRNVEVGNEYTNYYGSSNFQPEITDNGELILSAKFPQGSQTNIIYTVLQEPNQIRYNRDYDSQLDLVSSSVFTNVTENVSNFPFRIIRSLPQDAESLLDNWKTFLLNDYYEMPRNRGEIINLQEYFPVLLIHQRFGLFKTKNRATLSTDIIEVTLGSGNIFELPPVEDIPSKEGYAGTQNKFSCRLTKLGYSFVDALQGKWFLYNQQQLNELSNKGLRNFFIENLKVREQVLQNSTRNVTITYDSSLNISYIPKTLIEYDNKNKVFIDILPDVNWSNDYDNNRYYRAGNHLGLNPYTVDVIERYFNYIALDNPFAGTGYSIIFDEENTRLLLNKTKDCDEKLLTRQVELTRTLYVNEASSEPDIEVLDGDVASGGQGVTDLPTAPPNYYELNENGGVFFIDFNSFSLPDKLEIIWAGGVVAYSSMDNAVSPYYPSSDPDSGTLPHPGFTNSGSGGSSDNLLYNHISGGGTWSHWFIGINRTSSDPPTYGSIPSRITEFQADTGISYPITVGKQQRIWFKYTKEQADISNQVTVKVTGQGIGTAWDLAVLSTSNVNIEYWNGTEFVAYYSTWLTIDAPASPVPGATSQTFTAIPQWWNGSTWQDTETTYTQYWNGEDWQDRYTTYFDCNTIFLLPEETRGVYRVADNSFASKLRNGDIVYDIANTTYKEWVGGALQNITTKDEFSCGYSPAEDGIFSFYSFRTNVLTHTYSTFYSLKENKIFIHNKNKRLLYDDTQDSSYLDLVFNFGQKTLVEGVEILSEVFDEFNQQQYNQTVDKIRLWNTAQTTDVINLEKLITQRRTYDKFKFHNIRDINTYDRKFNKHILQNFDLKSSSNQNKLYFDKGRLIDNFVVIRVQIDNGNLVRIKQVNPLVKQIFR